LSTNKPKADSPTFVNVKQDPIVNPKADDIDKIKKDRDEANAATEKNQVLIDNLNRLIDQVIERVKDQCETIQLSCANIVSIRRELQIMKAQAQRNPEQLKQYLDQAQAETGSPSAIG
jgi:F0F1-type ATP synthase membrane subunit b/b'